MELTCLPGIDIGGMSGRHYQWVTDYRRLMPHAWIPAGSGNAWDQWNADWRRRWGEDSRLIAGTVVTFGTMGNDALDSGDWLADSGDYWALFIRRFRRLPQILLRTLA